MERPSCGSALVGFISLVLSKVSVLDTDCNGVRATGRQNGSARQISARNNGTRTKKKTVMPVSTKST